MEQHTLRMEHRNYLTENYGRFLLAAGYRDLQITAEDTQLLAMRVQRAIHAKAWARVDKSKGVVEMTPAWLSVLEEMTDEERDELRKQINFHPVAFEEYV